MYQAIIGRLTRVRQHPNADRLQLATVFWSQVVVSTEQKEGDLWIYFPPDWRLGERLCQINDLVRRKDEHGNNVWWMFDVNRKVRCQKFRWEKSEWFWSPIESLSYLWDIEREEGQMIDKIWDEVICEKFFNKATLAAASGNKQRKWSLPTFPKHVDTENIKYYRDDIKKWDIITITSKLHWTSARSGNTFVEKKQNRFMRMLWFKDTFVTEFLNWSRNVILADGKQDGFYNSNFRDKAAKLFRDWRKWEIFFYEIVWYEGDWTIMPRVDIKSLDKDTQKDLRDAWMPEVMTYHYWCAPWTSEVYVYRIAMVNEDGHMIEYPRNEVKARCNQLGIKHVPELYQDVFKGNVDVLQKRVNKLHDGPDTIGKTHRREWVVIRVDRANWWTEFYKAKNFIFLSLESAQKDTDAVDTEEAS